MTARITMGGVQWKGNGNGNGNGKDATHGYYDTVLMVSTIGVTSAMWGASGPFSGAAR